MSSETSEAMLSLVAVAGAEAAALTEEGGVAAVTVEVGVELRRRSWWWLCRGRTR